MTTILSQHSSNPFELPSSDVRNRAYRKLARRASRAHVGHDHASSDDPLNSYNVSEMETYHSHIGQLYPQNPTLANLPFKSNAPREVDLNEDGMVDLHADMSDELYIPTPSNKEQVRDHQERQLQQQPRQARYANKGYDDACLADDDEEPEEERDSEHTLITHSNTVEIEDDGDDDDDDEEDDDDASSTSSAASSSSSSKAMFSEEHSIHLRSREEQLEIASEIEALSEALPTLSQDYQLLDRLGTGTFSSVYKALDLHYHTKWDNALWHGTHPSGSSAHYQSVPHREEEKVYVAIKRIYVTSGPERIRNEISIMDSVRGCRHVSQLITAFRHEDQVVAIMPYNRNEDFRDYYKTLHLDGIKTYFRCMFRALRDIHARGIIHRDVKPANFLFDPYTGIGTLCDFGLACRMEPGPSHGACLHTPPTPDHPHGKIKPQNEYNVEEMKRIQREARTKSGWASDRVGYPTKDNRPRSKANRSGTRGFRAPEVLLKCGEQSGAIDVWSAGVILLTFLTGKFPLFQSNDDMEAFMEIATILGRKKIERTAALHNRTFQSNVPSITLDGISWSEFVVRLSPDIYKPRKPDPKYHPPATSPHQASTLSNPADISDAHSHSPNHPPPTSSSSPRSFAASRFSPSLDDSEGEHALDAEIEAETKYRKEMDQALDFVEKIMHPESVRRLTPRQALYHPFLHEGSPGGREGDDEFCPHAHGGGVCGMWHEWDEETEEMVVKVKARNAEGREEWVQRRVAPGEYVPIGRRPCELHKEEDGYVYE